ncbi:GNAT family N-acetyltransferase [Actinomycetota bacterium]|nr:GNAT family N-acetyltransferase [Micrococcales bacterium]
MTRLDWAPLTDADLPALEHLAMRCLEHDGGLPELDSKATLRGFFLSRTGIGGRDEMGDLLAAAGVFLERDGRLTCTGLVHPSVRGQGIGQDLVRWGHEHGAVPIRVLIENVGPAAMDLMAQAGLTQVFSEHVMCHDLAKIPVVRRPAGLHVEPYRDDTKELFHAAYRGSFGDRPGFPDTPLDQWVEWLFSDPDFRPQDSRVALDDEGRPAGFVTVADDWIEQVGVVPEWRGRGLGAHLMARSLTALRKAGSTKVWLCVNIDNSAHELYQRLGFVDAGRRARFSA